MTKNLSGEFISADADGNEHIVPNQFTILGMQQVLYAAFWKTPFTWYMGHCAHNPADMLALNAIAEPTIGVQGYQRVAIPMDQYNWPTLGQVNGESYIETRNCDFIVTAAHVWDKQTNRYFITDGTAVIAISSATEEGLVNRSASFTTKYRLYFR